MTKLEEKMSRAAKLRLIDRPHELNLISTYSDPFA